MKIQVNSTRKFLNIGTIVDDPSLTVSELPCWATLLIDGREKEQVRIHVMKHFGENNEDLHFMVVLDLFDVPNGSILEWE